MSKEQKLKKIIEFAEKRGYKFQGWSAKDMVQNAKVGSPVYKAVLFSHDFAEAVFGKKSNFVCFYCKEVLNPQRVTYKEKCSVCGRDAFLVVVSEWHLQQAVISDPIEYYYKFINKEKGRK